MQVSSAVVISKLAYGLDTLQFTDTEARALDVFQLRGLRKILKLDTTFVNRENANMFVYATANERIGTVAPHIIPISDYIRKRQITLLGHVIRMESHAPIRQVCFANDNLASTTPATRRVGKPRLQWIHLRMSEAWHQMNPLTPYTAEEQQRSIITLSN